MTGTLLDGPPLLLAAAALLGPARDLLLLLLLALLPLLPLFAREADPRARGGFAMLDGRFRMPAFGGREVRGPVVAAAAADGPGPPAINAANAAPDTPATAANAAVSASKVGDDGGCEEAAASAISDSDSDSVSDDVEESDEGSGDGGDGGIWGEIVEDSSSGEGDGPERSESGMTGGPPRGDGGVGCVLVGEARAESEAVEEDSGAKEDGSMLGASMLENEGRELLVDEYSASYSEKDGLENGDVSGGASPAGRHPSATRAIKKLASSFSATSPPSTCREMVREARVEARRSKSDGLLSEGAMASVQEGGGRGEGRGRERLYSYCPRLIRLSSNSLSRSSWLDVSDRYPRPTTGLSDHRPGKMRARNRKEKKDTRQSARSRTVDPRFCWVVGFLGDGFVEFRLCGISAPLFFPRGNPGPSLSWMPKKRKGKCRDSSVRLRILGRESSLGVGEGGGEREQEISSSWWMFVSSRE